MTSTDSRRCENNLTRNKLENTNDDVVNGIGDGGSDDGNVGVSEQSTGCKKNRLTTRPLFLTTKVSVRELSDIFNVCDFQLQDHFINTKNLYVSKCKCINHKHNRRQCRITYEAICRKCNGHNPMLIDYQSLLFHSNLMQKSLYNCCPHVHEPPCRRCLFCKTNRPCIIQNSFECTITSGKFNRD